jgi:hypothetical protein
VSLAFLDVAGLQGPLLTSRGTSSRFNGPMDFMLVQQSGGPSQEVLKAVLAIVVVACRRRGAVPRRTVRGQIHAHRGDGGVTNDWWFINALSSRGGAPTQGRLLKIRKASLGILGARRHRGRSPEIFGTGEIGEIDVTLVAFGSIIYCCVSAGITRSHPGSGLDKKVRQENNLHVDK